VEKSCENRVDGGAQQSLDISGHEAPVEQSVVSYLTPTYPYSVCILLIHY
jgi:hypothetical protein